MPLQFGANAVPTPRLLRGIGVQLALYVIVVLALMWRWSYEPAQFDVVKRARQRATVPQQQLVTGAVVTSTLMGCAETLLDKCGGYFSNGKFPPGLFMDNVPMMANDVSRANAAVIDLKSLSDRV